MPPTIARPACRLVDRIAGLVHALTDSDRQRVPPVPAAAPRHAGQRWRLEACGACFAALQRVLHACWQQLEETAGSEWSTASEDEDEQPQDEQQQGSKRPGDSDPAPEDESEDEDEDQKDKLELAAYLLERTQNAWGAACCAAVSSLMEAGPPGRCAGCWGAAGCSA